MLHTIGRSETSIPVLAAGNGWLAVDKPAGVSVHNDPGADLVSIVAAHLASDSDWARHLAGDPDFGMAAVHRLDRETSGVLLMAARADVFRYFSAQFETHTAVKRYTALVHGRLGRPGESGDWTRPLTKGAAGRRNPAGTGPKVPCTTRFQVLAHSTHYSLIHCEPVTGRKHQIRRHAKIAGHPVLGDRRYGSGRSVAFLADRCGFSRLALHADRLTVSVPENREPIVIRSGTLPRAMDRLFTGDLPPVAH